MFKVIVIAGVSLMLLDVAVNAYHTRGLVQYLREDVLS